MQGEQDGGEGGGVGDRGTLRGPEADPQVGHAGTEPGQRGCGHLRAVGPFVTEGDAEGVNRRAGGVDVSRYRVRYRVWCGHQASPSAAAPLTPTTGAPRRGWPVVWRLLRLLV